MNDLFRTGCLCLFAVLLVPLSKASADGEVAIRSVYYKEDATRVMQPMMDANFSVGENGRADGHFLVDAISSASIAAGASGASFTETRLEGGLGYSHQIGDVTLAGNGRYSKEPDYESVFASLRGQIELYDENTVLEFGLSRGHDEITNGSQQGIAEPISGTLNTTLGSLRVSQLLSPKVSGAIVYDAILAEGFLQNAYRSVAAGGTLQRERVPEKRLRHAIAANTKAYLESTNSILDFRYRFYIDDWGIVAHTPELRLIQPVLKSVFAQLRYRFHKQSRAYFYKDTYNSSDPAIEPFLTNDPKLSAFTTHTFGGTLEVSFKELGLSGRLENIRTEATLEYLIQRNRFGNAIIAQFAIVVPFEYD